MNRAPADRGAIALSVVIPVYNEAENVLPLLDEIRVALAGRVRFEVLFVNDCSDDNTVDRILPHVGGDNPVRLLSHQTRSGQSAAIRTGVAAAVGRWVATLDGDGQNDPADIPRLLVLVDATGGSLAPSLVGGLRTKRQDTWSRRLAGRFANGLRKALLRDDCTDTGCGLKLFRRDTFLQMPYFASMHRFLPALFKAHGHHVAFVPVNHRPRERGVSKYTNLRRGAIGILDLLGVYWLTRRTRLPPVVTEH